MASKHHGYLKDGRRSIEERVFCERGDSILDMSVAFTPTALHLLPHICILAGLSSPDFIDSLVLPLVRILQINLTRILRVDIGLVCA